MIACGGANALYNYHCSPVLIEEPEYATKDTRDYIT